MSHMITWKNYFAERSKNNFVVLWKLKTDKQCVKKF